MQAPGADAPMQDMGERIRGGRFLILRKNRYRGFTAIK